MSYHDNIVFAKDFNDTHGVSNLQLLRRGKERQGGEDSRGL